MSPTFVMSTAAVVTPVATLFFTSRMFLLSTTAFFFFFSTSPVDLGQKKVVQRFLAGANIAKTFEKTRVMTVLKMQKNVSTVKSGCPKTGLKFAYRLSDKCLKFECKISSHNLSRTSLARLIFNFFLKWARLARQDLGQLGHNSI